MNVEELKREYASLLIDAGLNVQKGQSLVITCPVEGAEFARLCAKAGYDAGCREVIMRWTDDEITRDRYLYADDDVFDQVRSWTADLPNTMSAEGAAWLSIYAENPENLKGVDPDRIRRAKIASGKALSDFRAREMRSDFPWCVASIPTAAWARSVFPDMTAQDAMDRLWQEIFKACRVGENTLDAWKAHSEELHRRVEILNGYNFRQLRYHNAAGTDVTVDMPENYFWEGGEERSSAGITFSANIPTEEVFTLPHREGINGHIVATKPLSLSGSLIENFWFDVENGKIVNVGADHGEEILRDAISVDEGASYFGEVALVPYHSPISESGILFLNTLFDENASCHFAFGEAYPCIRDAEAKTEDELRKLGVNYSMTHVDFMVGSPDLMVIGTTEAGEEVIIMKNGDFAL